MEESVFSNSVMSGTNISKKINAEDKNIREYLNAIYENIKEAESSFKTNESRSSVRILKKEEKDENSHFASLLQKSGTSKSNLSNNVRTLTNQQKSNSGQKSDDTGIISKIKITNNFERIDEFDDPFKEMIEVTDLDPIEQGLYLTRNRVKAHTAQRLLQKYFRQSTNKRTGAREKK